MVGDVQRLYQEDVAVAHRIAEAHLLAEAMTGASERERSDTAELLRSEAQAQATLADVLAEASPLAEGDPRRTIRLDGADLLARLAEIRAERSSGLASLDPDGTQAQAEEQAEASSLLAAAVIPVAFAFLVGALAEVFSGARRALLGVGYGLVLAGIAAAIVIELTI